MNWSVEVITRIKSELETIAAGSEQSGSWLASAMEASWGMAEALLAYPQLVDLLAERHKIIGNNWQNAFTTQLIARSTATGTWLPTAAHTFQWAQRSSRW